MYIRLLDLLLLFGFIDVMASALEFSRDGEGRLVAREACVGCRCVEDRFAVGSWLFRKALTLGAQIIASLIILLI